MIKILLFILSFTAVCKTSANPIATNELESTTVEHTSIEINKIIDSYVDSHALGAGVILVAKYGTIVHEQAYGLDAYSMDQRINQPMQLDNAFQLASLTKPITATLVLKLADQGVLNLDSSLSEFFTEFNTDFGKQTHLHHLLSHTSGMPDHFSIDGWFDPAFHRQTSEQEFLKLIAEQPAAFEPGTDYLYSNLGYFVLGKIIEKATGESFSSNIKKHIFQPLNMTHSGVATGFQSYSNNVKGYQWKKAGGYKAQVAKNMSLLGAGAAAFASAKDLYRFDLALYGEQMLSNTSKNRLFDPEQAYSWRIGKIPLTQDTEVNIHTYDGKFDGYSTMMTRFIDDKHSIIILSNTGMSYYLKQQLTIDIAAALYNQAPPNRNNDASLMLIKGIVNGTFNQTFNNIKLKKNVDFNEQSLSALAFELLWSNMPTNALQLFTLISNEFPNSLQARHNLQQACSHRLARSVVNKLSFCK